MSSGCVGRVCVDYVFEGEIGLSVDVQETFLEGESV